MNTRPFAPLAHPGNYRYSEKQDPSDENDMVQVSGLTKREREVAAFVAEGLTNRDIANRLVISDRTVETHVEHIRNKLGVRSRAQVATWTVTGGEMQVRSDTVLAGPFTPLAAETPRRGAELPAATSLFA